MEKERLSREEIEKRVTEYIIKEQSLDPNEVKTDSLLVDDLGFDSLDFAEMALDLEEEFNITISDEEVERIRTVGDIIDYLFNAQ